jgi:phosphoribosylaminoimidazolecarboxamide formyltransferase/IMP cyclohydrolase
MALRYGMNPNQKPARVFSGEGGLPFNVLNGSPGYINMLDALNSWQLVREIKQILKLPAAASFKHVSPAGAAVSVPLTDVLKKSYFIEDIEMSSLSTAYARARGADRVSSYGDWAALSETVDLPTARILGRETSDGVIAPGYEPEALEILKKKKGGKYPVIEIDAAYEPKASEIREVYGIGLEQNRNDLVVGPDMLTNIVTENKELPESAVRDLIVATTTIKYTQSNTIGLAVDGQAIGVGAGQQSRIHCARIAGDKADRWFLRQHPTVLSLKWKQGVGRAVKNTAIDLYLQEKLTTVEMKNLEDVLEEVPPLLTAEERADWLGKQTGVVLSSDAFMPFRDTVDRAYRSGVKYIAQAGNSIRDEEVIEACNTYGMVMIFTGVRLFHH